MLWALYFINKNVFVGCLIDFLIGWDWMSSLFPTTKFMPGEITDNVMKIVMSDHMHFKDDIFKFSFWKQVLYFDLVFNNYCFQKPNLMTAQAAVWVGRASALHRNCPPAVELRLGQLILLCERSLLAKVFPVAAFTNMHG